MSAPQPVFLEAVAAEIEAHVARAGWDRPPALFALVRAGQFSADEPEAAARLGLTEAGPATLTPIEQDSLPDGPLDEVLAQIAWPDEVAGCALSHEIVVLPPSAEAELALLGSDDDSNAVAAHPERREARLVAAVLRDGTTAVVLRLRATSDADAGTEPTPDDLLTGPDLAPNLVQALAATLS